ncbi:DUF6998 domain-containing protein [Gordonia malaquae]|uniref:DUF6998 domain-containing protein n=1 Tax=Gordonia malaquae TaxID=410332 RepID=UPI0030161968
MNTTDTPHPSLTGMSVQDLLRLDADIIAELRARGVVRTSNKPIGDIAEAIVHTARGGAMEPNSRKSHDITSRDGTRIQVKAMGTRAAGNSGKFSPFRSLDFDTSVFLLFDATFTLTEAREVSASDIETLPVTTHINGRQPRLTWVRQHGTDVTAEMTTAWSIISRVAATNTPAVR